MTDVHRRTWLAWLAVGAIIASVPFQQAVGRDGPPRVIDVRIEGRQVVAPKGAIRVVENDVIELRWVSDEAVRLHLHGYDKKLRLRPGEPASMSITARATGRFAITSHGWGKHGARRGHGHHALTYLEVYPR